MFSADQLPQTLTDIASFYLKYKEFFVLSVQDPDAFNSQVLENHAEFKQVIDDFNNLLMDKEGKFNIFVVERMNKPTLLLSETFIRTFLENNWWMVENNLNKPKSFTPSFVALVKTYIKTKQHQDFQMMVEDKQFISFIQTVFFNKFATDIENKASRGPAHLHYKLMSDYTNAILGRPAQKGLEGGRIELLEQYFMDDFRLVVCLVLNAQVMNDTAINWYQNFAQDKIANNRQLRDCFNTLTDDSYTQIAKYFPEQMRKDQDIFLQCLKIAVPLVRDDVLKLQLEMSDTTFKDTIRNLIILTILKELKQDNIVKLLPIIFPDYKMPLQTAVENSNEYSESLLDALASELLATEKRCIMQDHSHYVTAIKNSVTNLIFYYQLEDAVKENEHNYAKVAALLKITKQAIINEIESDIDIKKSASHDIPHKSIDRLKRVKEFTEKEFLLTLVLTLDGVMNHIANIDWSISENAYHESIIGLVRDNFLDSLPEEEYTGEVAEEKDAEEPSSSYFDEFEYDDDDEEEEEEDDENDKQEIAVNQHEEYKDQNSKTSVKTIFDFSGLFPLSSGQLKDASASSSNQLKRSTIVEDQNKNADERVKRAKIDKK